MTIKRSIECLREKKRYLAELGILSNRIVDEEAISADISEVLDSNQSHSLESFPVLKFSMPFYELKGEKFKTFIEELFSRNDGEIYILTPRTKACGLFKVSSINSISFQFPFEINPEGILVFLTSDLKDKLLLDFSLDSSGKKMLEIEVRGQHWSNAMYGD